MIIYSFVSLTDFAVGAPFHGTGSVMIFNGGTRGVSSQPSQVKPYLSHKLQAFFELCAQVENKSVYFFIHLICKLKTIVGLLSHLRNICHLHKR